MELATVFLFCFFVGFFFALGSAVLGGLVGGEGHGFGAHGFDAHGDFQVDPSTAVDSGHLPAGSHELHFSPFSPTILATFLTAFGATGYLLHKAADLSPLESISGALVGALAVSAGFFVLLAKFFSAAQKTSEVRTGDLLGATAEVVSGIPPQGLGEIVFTAMGGRTNAPAASASGEPIPKHTPVRIARIVGGTYYVEPLARPAREPR
ncbi:MAG TPA: NfeD family protein [Planctomycetota bacterium]|jgi:membrane protein implicated in regulation of membrane protease activity|nr:NfeD family protein [Planctomycetota bacterium]